MNQILISCKTALTQGRYQRGMATDQVLKEICIEAERKKKHLRESGNNPGIAFVRAGEESKDRTQPLQGLLYSGNDWQMRGEIGE